MCPRHRAKIVPRPCGTLSPRRRPGLEKARQLVEDEFFAAFRLFDNKVQRMKAACQTIKSTCNGLQTAIDAWSFTDFDLLFKGKNEPDKHLQAAAKLVEQYVQQFENAKPVVVKMQSNLAWMEKEAVVQQVRCLADQFERVNADELDSARIPWHIAPSSIPS